MRYSLKKGNLSFFILILYHKYYTNINVIQYVMSLAGE